MNFTQTFLLQWLRFTYKFPSPTGGCAMSKMPSKTLIQRERDRLDSQQAKILAMLDDLHREQQRLAHEAQELDVAERVINRLELEMEAEVKVLPYNPPVARRGAHFLPETEVLDLGSIAEMGGSRLERA
jgi:hypothetical protein